MSNSIELVTSLRDKLSGPLQRQAALLGTWQGKVAAAAVAATGAGIAVAAATARFIRFADSLTRPYSATWDLAQGLQVDAQELAALQYVITQAGGAGDSLAMTFQQMRNHVAAAADASSVEAQMLDRIGLSYAELQGLDPVQMYERIAGGLSTLAGTTEQAQAAQALLGRGASQLRGALNLSTAQYQQATAAAIEFGVVLGTDSYEAADRFQDGLKTIRDQFNVMLMSGLEPSLPKLLELLDSLMELSEVVLPVLLDHAGDIVGVFRDVTSAFAAVKEAIDAIPLGQLGSDIQTNMTGWERLADAVLPSVGTSISLVRQGIEALSPATEEAAETGDVFAEAFDAVRAAASAAEAELTELEAVMDGIAEGMIAKKEDQFRAIQAAREAMGTADVEQTLTEEEEKQAAAETRIDAEKARELERIQVIAEAEAAAEETEMARLDRIAAKAQSITDADKRARLAAEDEIARQREAAIQRGIDQTAAFGWGMIEAGLNGQEAWDGFWNRFYMRMVEMVFSEAFGMLLQVITGGGGGLLGGLFGALFQHGGTVQHAAGGMIVPGTHRGDRVPALLEPGERVLTRDEARDYSGRGRAAVATVNVSLGSMFSGASRSDLIRAGKVLREVMRAEGLL